MVVGGKDEKALRGDAALGFDRFFDAPYQMVSLLGVDSTW
jgi:hypothetical protein